MRPARPSARRRASEQTPARERAGMTLVELLVAMGILLIGMSAVLGLLTTGAVLARSAVQRTTAAAAAEAVVADLEEVLFPLEQGADPFAQPGEPRSIVERVLPGSAGIVYSARATQNPERPDEYLVEIELAWVSGGLRRAKSFRTLLVRELPFGERLRRRFVEGSRGGAPSAPSAPTPAAPDAKARR